MDLPHNESVGGVRVRQVTTFLPDGSPSDTVNYGYLSERDTSLSSGILINTPRYGIKYTTDNLKAVERFNLCNSMYDFTQTHIEYSHVREYRSAAGYTDYFYSTYDDHPDGADTDVDKKTDKQFSVIIQMVIMMKECVFQTLTIWLRTCLPHSPLPKQCVDC